MGFTTYFDNKALGYLFGQTAFTLGTIHFALHNGVSAPTGDGSNFQEPSSGAYGRVSYTNNAAGWTNPPTTKQTQNKVAIQFPTATGSWGTVTHFGIYDAGSAGNLLAWALLAASKTIGTGDTASFAIDALTITLT